MCKSCLLVSLCCILICFYNGQVEIQNFQSEIMFTERRKIFKISLGHWLDYQTSVDLQIIKFNYSNYKIIKVCRFPNSYNFSGEKALDHLMSVNNFKSLSKEISALG